MESLLRIVAAGILGAASCAFAFIGFYLYSKFRGGEPIFDKASLPPLFWFWFAVALVFVMVVYPGIQGLEHILRRLVS